MKPCELTAAITAAANLISKGLTIDELNFLGMILTLLGDTIVTIAAQQSWQENKKPSVK
ncbi:MAG: hypothetical protein IKU09_04045 [Firmicutes bacterium]|nr:hypothetical protein [Bacillota bacterium]